MAEALYNTIKDFSDKHDGIGVWFNADTFNGIEFMMQKKGGKPYRKVIPNGAFIKPFLEQMLLEMEKTENEEGV